MEIPEILYKYRDFNNSNHKTLLTHSEIYLSKRSQFEDFNDAAKPFKYKQEQLTVGNLRKKMRQNLILSDSTLNEPEIQEKIEKRLSEMDFTKDDYWYESVPFFKETINNKIGILSLAGDWNHEAIWEEYGKKRTGFCVGMNSLKLREFIGGNIRKVKYEAGPVEVDLFANSSEGLELSICRKDLKYSYEDEYRFYKVNEAGEKKYLPDGVFEKVILGDKMNQENRDEIIRKIEILHKGMKVYNLVYKGETNSFTKKRIL